MSTLTTDELARIKAELGDNILSINALPYIGIKSVYSQVILDNVVSSDTAATSTSTTISQATVDAGGATTITVASATGLSVGTRIQIDVDSQRETCTVRNVSGTTISIIAKKPHSGTYPVEIESPLTLVRGTLSDLLSLEQNQFLDAYAQAGIKRVDEVEFADNGAFGALTAQRQMLRARLASQLGLTEVWLANQQRAGNSTIEIY